MGSQDSIETSASDLPPSGSGSARGGTPSGSAPGASAPGASGLVAWGLSPGSNFPSDDNPKYRIKAEIDDGGMGIVYEAHQGGLGVVAIKVIKPRILGHTASERFLNEARAMAKVRAEPGIATIYDCDFYTDPGTGTRAPYMVMEYIPGAASITSYAREHGLDARGRLELFERVCRAVGVAHRAEIIHRDLKPANVMISSGGGPKIIDFGLAVVRDPNEHALNLPSERGGLFGTLEYMSPEQAAKRFDPYVLTPASDVYSLGVILYELLLGRLPYERHPGFAVRRFPDAPSDYTEATRIIREDAPIAPHKVDPSIHPELERILLRALEKDPSRRYADAGEMARAIRGYVQGAARRDVVRAAPIVALAVLLAYFVGIPALFNKTPVNEWWQRAAAAMAPALPHFQHVVMVIADERTDPGVVLGGAPAAPDVGFADKKRQRPLWAAVGRKLSDSQCAVVCFDLLMDAPAPEPEDDEAMSGMLEVLRARGIGAVIGTWEWADRLASEVSSFLEAPGQRSGAVWLHAKSADLPWMIEVALERDGKVMPSISLASVAASRHPGEEVLYLFEPGDRIRVHHGPPGDVAAMRASEDAIVVSRIVDGLHPDLTDAVEDSTDVYTERDRVALLVLATFPSAVVLDNSVIKVEELMGMSRAEMQSRLQGKIVLLANAHKDHTGEFVETPVGTVRPKSFGHAIAIETMLQRGAAIRTPALWIEAGSTLMAGVLGVLLAFWLPGRWGHLAAWTAVAVLLLVAGSLLVLRGGGPALNPVIPGSAAIVAALGAAGGREALRRIGV